MNIRKAVPGILVVVICAAAIIVLQPITAKRNYERGIQSQRRELDEFMGQGVGSPIPPAERKEFSGLRYYAIDEKYRVKANLTRFTDPEIIEVPLTSGAFDRYTRYGMAEFNLDDTTNSLELWKPESGSADNRLFVAFTDATSGDITYGGGRYLNLYLDNTDYIMIDFNLAYNPYCVYDYSYACPLAPPENRLSIAVEAGEMSYP